jgi:hypothetical protein
VYVLGVRCFMKTLLNLYISIEDLRLGCVMPTAGVIHVVAGSETKQMVVLAGTMLVQVTFVAPENKGGKQSHPQFEFCVGELGIRALENAFRLADLTPGTAVTRLSRLFTSIGDACCTL